MPDFLALCAILALVCADFRLNHGSPYYPVRVSDYDYECR